MTRKTANAQRSLFVAVTITSVTLPARVQAEIVDRLRALILQVATHEGRNPGNPRKASS